MSDAPDRFLGFEIISSSQLGETGRLDADFNIAYKRSLDHMKTPSRWVDGVCPVDREINGKTQMAMLHHDRPSVTRGNKYDGFKGIFTEGAETGIVHDYPSYEALLADGWRVAE